jgi:hypothetical protein
MSYATGTATSVENLVDILQTWASGTAGWTVDEYSAANNRCSMHLGTVYVHFKWEDSGNYLAIYQSLGYVGTEEPWEHTDNSGVSDATSPYDGARHVNFLTAGSFTAYHFFAPSGAPYYIHVAVEPASGRFRHFGFGDLIKCGDWTGGEYCYGHFWDQGASGADVPNSALHSMMLDGLASGSTRSATIHAEGLPQQGVSEKWLVASSSGPTSGVDDNGEDRRTFIASTRCGLYSFYLSWIRNSQLNLYKPLAPIEVMFRDISTSPDTYYKLGSQPDVAIINMGNFNPGDEITLGGDTWKVFPWVRKQFLEDNTEESRNGGIAYKKI